MKRTVLEVIELNMDQPQLLVKVIANGSTFWEYYVGVPKGNQFYSIYPFLEETDPRCDHLKGTTFKGCQKHFSDYNSFAKVRPIAGAWLSFARAGGNKEYPFLKKDFFYYGGGMLVRGPNTLQNEENCKEDAEVMIRRLFNELYTDVTDMFNIPETTEEEVLAQALKEIKGFRYSVNKNARQNILKFDPKELKLTSIGLYERGNSRTGKIYFIGGTDYLVNSKLEIYLNDKTGCGNMKTFITYTEAILFKCGLFPLNKEERNTLRDMLKLKKEPDDDCSSSETE